MTLSFIFKDGSIYFKVPPFRHTPRIHQILMENTGVKRRFVPCFYGTEIVETGGFATFVCAIHHVPWELRDVEDSENKVFGAALNTSQGQG